MNKLILKNLFDYYNFSHRNLLDKYQYPWEVILNLNDYLAEILPKGNRSIGEGSIINSSAKIEGRVVIGKNCAISDSVLIRGGCIIGDNVNVGHGVEIKHSIVMSNTAIAHLNYIGDSMIGNNVNVGGGAIIANWRFDKESIKIRVGEEIIDTKMKKFGAAVGDSSSIGVNSALSPGVILGKKSIIYPVVHVSGVYDQGSVIKK